MRRLARRNARPPIVFAPSPVPSPTAATDPELPAFAKKADDLEALKKAVDDAAAVGSGLWLSYLVTLFYLCVAVGAVTHADLFFEKPINLLFLNVQLPIVGFFAVAPLLFLALHAYALMHLAMLTAKARRFHTALRAQISDRDALSAAKRANCQAMRDGLRAQLPVNLFVQLVGGPSESRTGGFGWGLRAVAWSTLVVGPALLLLGFQVQFLPYHHRSIIWLHRVALWVDLLIVWWLWRRILADREPDERSKPRLARLPAWIGNLAGLSAAGAAVLTSLLLVTYRGEGWATQIAAVDRFGVVATLHNAIFHSEVIPQARRRSWFLSDTLVLPRIDALESLKFDSPESMTWKGYIFSAQERDLVGADFRDAVLPRFDFSGAILTGADFSTSHPGDLVFDATFSPGMALQFPERHAIASLSGTILRGASFEGAHLQGASFTGTELQGASFDQAELQGGRLNAAGLQGASFDGAHLQGASLEAAYLAGASLADADARSAYFDRAQLSGAFLSGAKLQAASFQRTDLQGADFADAEIDAADFSGAGLWRSNGAAKEVNNVLLWGGSAWTTWVPSDLGFFGEEYVSGLWRPADLDALNKQLELVPNAVLRKEALDRLRALDCADRDRDLCEPDFTWIPPLPRDPREDAWRKQLFTAQVDEDTHRKALASRLRTLVCSSDTNEGDAAREASAADRPHIVRGIGFLVGLAKSGDWARSLVADLSDPAGRACPVAAELTGQDLQRLSGFVTSKFFRN